MSLVRTINASSWTSNQRRLYELIRLWRDVVAYRRNDDGHTSTTHNSTCISHAEIYFNSNKYKIRIKTDRNFATKYTVNGSI